MAFLDWSSTYSVGVKVIDEDHKALFEIVNALHDSIKRGDTDRSVGSALEALVNYVEQHFAREERYMRECGYPELARHISAHTRLAGTVRSVQELHQSEPDQVDTEELLDFLKDWLTRHIVKVDSHYSPYLRGEKKGVAQPENGQNGSAVENGGMVNVQVPAEKAALLRRCATILLKGGEDGRQLERILLSKAPFARKKPGKSDAESP